MSGRSRELRIPGSAADAAGGPLDHAHPERSCRWVPAGQSEDITPTVSGEKRGKTAAVEAPKRVETTSASTLR